jgi:DNA-binding response OmpR family regulator
VNQQPEARPPRLLLVDDDRELCELLRDYLEPLGYDVQAVHNGPDGVVHATGEEWQAVILDVMLPGMDGFEVLKGIRKTSMVPVLMLTSRGDEMDRIVGLEVGADDYLPKTFSMRELLARLRAVTRRSALGNAQPPGSATDDGVQPEVVVGPLRVNPNNRVALLDDRPLLLTPVEFDILHSLAKARGRVKTREQLLDEIRDREWEVFDRSVDVHIAALRRKPGDDARQPRFIRTLRSAGYMLVDPETM